MYTDVQHHQPHTSDQNMIIVSMSVSSTKKRQQFNLQAYTAQQHRSTAAPKIYIVLCYEKSTDLVILL